MLIELTDEQLLALAMNGDEDAFAMLYRRRQGPVYRFALHMSGSPQIAEEVTQDVFVFLAQRGRDFDASRAPLGAYLFGVARNYVRRAMERSFNESLNTVAAEDHADSLVASDNTVEDLARGQLFTAIRKAVRSLPQHYREVVILCDLQELSYAEAAAAIGCAIGTIRSRLHRAHEMLAKKLQHSAAVAPDISGLAARCPS